SLRTARLRRAAVLQELAPLQQMSCRLPGFIGPVPPPLLIRVEATCAIQLSRRSTLRVVYPRLAAVSTKNVNKKFRPLAARPEEARQVPAKRRRQASFGAEEGEKRREGGGGQGGEPGRRRG